MKVAATMPWMIMVILLTLLDRLSSEVACISLADIYWNATNPIFRIDNTDHIIDVNKNNLPFEYDQVNIICPVYPHSNPGTSEEENEEEEQYIIYNVSKEEYDSCRITNPHPRIIAICDKPNQLMYFTITFRSFTPQPGGLEFLPGHDYYFVSTSSGDPSGLHQLVGGKCATHNMKVIFKVCCGPDSKDGSSSNSQPAANTTAGAVASAAPPKETISKRPLESKTFERLFPSVASPTPSALPPPPPYHLRPYEVPIEDEMDRSPPQEKSKEEVSAAKAPGKRERAKNEELVNSAHRRSPHGAYFSLLLMLLLHRLLRLR